MCCGCRGLDKVVALCQKSGGGFQIKAGLDRDERQDRVQRECHDAGQEAQGDAHGKKPMLEAGDALLMRMLGKWLHLLILQWGASVVPG